MRLRMKWIIGIIGNIIYGSKINKHPTTTIFQCAWFTHRHSSVILGSFQGVIVIRLPRNFVYLCCTLYLLMINDLSTTSLVYLWSVDTVSQSLLFRRIASGRFTYVSYCILMASTLNKHKVMLSKT